MFANIHEIKKYIVYRYLQGYYKPGKFIKTELGELSYKNLKYLLQKNKIKFVENHFKLIDKDFRERVKGVKQKKRLNTNDAVGYIRDGWEGVQKIREFDELEGFIKNYEDRNTPLSQEEVQKKWGELKDKEKENQEKLLAYVINNYV